MSEPIGFKEWSPVCAAMQRGEQSIILRKGGIHEGRKGFQFLHDRFWLFPTAFHSEPGRLRAGTELGDGSDTGSEEGDSVTIHGAAEIVWKRDLTSFAQVEALAPFHVWGDELLRERFVYSDDERLWLAFVRVHALETPWKFPWTKNFGGCRSWLELPSEGSPEFTAQTSPVLADPLHRELENKILKAIDLS